MQKVQFQKDQKPKRETRRGNQQPKQSTIVHHESGPEFQRTQASAILAAGETGKDRKPGAWKDGDLNKDSWLY